MPVQDDLKPIEIFPILNFKFDSFLILPWLIPFIIFQFNISELMTNKFWSLVMRELFWPGVSG